MPLLLPGRACDFASGVWRPESGVEEGGIGTRSDKLVLQRPESWSLGGLFGRSVDRKYVESRLIIAAVASALS